MPCSWKRCKPWNMHCGTGPTERPNLGLCCILLLVWCYMLLELKLYLVVESSPVGATLPISRNTSSTPCSASPYCFINIKSLLLGIFDFYFYKPISVILNSALDLDMWFSANFISGSHIVVALIASKLITHESLNIRRIGVLVYSLRNMLDCLDGVIARVEVSRRATHKLEFTSAHPVTNKIWEQSHDMENSLGSSVSNQVGYFIDGICDGLGCIFLSIACLIYMQRYSQRRVVYSPLTVVSVNNNKVMKNKPDSEIDGNLYVQPDSCLQVMVKSVMGFWATVKMSLSSGNGTPAIHFLIQLFFSSMFWNRTILYYTKMIEQGPSDSEAVKSFKSSLTHSFVLWLIIFSWRIINPLTMTEFLLMAIFFNKMESFLYFIQFLGFFIISLVASLSEIYSNDLTGKKH